VFFFLRQRIPKVQKQPVCSSPDDTLLVTRDRGTIVSPLRWYVLSQPRGSNGGRGDRSIGMIGSTPIGSIEWRINYDLVDSDWVDSDWVI